MDYDSQIAVSKDFISSNEHIYSKRDSDNSGETFYLDLYYISDGFKIFEFLSNNTSVEWSHVRIDDDYSVVGTSHFESEDGTTGYLETQNTSLFKKISLFDHCHTSSDVSPSQADINMAIKITENNPDAKFRIFNASNFNLYQKYDSKSEVSITTLNVFEVTNQPEK